MPRRRVCRYSPAPPAPPGPALGIERVAALLGYTLPHLRRVVASGCGPIFHRRGTRTLFSLEAVRVWIEEELARSRPVTDKCVSSQESAVPSA